MSEVRRARRLLALGAVLCIPGAFGVALYTTGAMDADAVHAAPICSAPDRDAATTCLSELNGVILQRIPGGSKALPQVSITVAASTYTVGYDCLLSAQACDTLAVQAGTRVTTGWWKGQLVAFGVPGVRPGIVTDASPESHLFIEAYALGLVIPGVSLLLAGLLAMRSPMSDGELIESAVAQSPEPPRVVDRLLIRRVAWGHMLWPLSIGWTALYLIPGGLILYGTGMYRWGPLLLLATFVVSFAFAAVVAPNYLSDLVRTSIRRTIVVQRVETGLGKGGDATQISYQLADGRTESRTLDSKWKHLKAGDRIDALMDPKSRYIRRVLSTPPA